MNKDLEVALLLRLNDQASAGVSRFGQKVVQTFSQAERSTATLTQRLQGYNQQLDSASTKSSRLAVGMAAYATQCWSAEQRTQGLLSSVRRLANERGPTALVNTLREIVSHAGRAQQAMRGIAAGWGAATAAGYVVSKPLGQTMDYGVRLANMANTAFTDRDTAGRIAGKTELDNAIRAAVRGGGGTREGAAETLDTLIASGAMPIGDAMKLLPTLTRAGTASNADPNQLAQIAIRGMQTFKIAPGQVGNAIDMAIAAGQAGGFELRDMAKWLPQQMAAGRMSGMSGISGLAKLLAANQAAAITAGTKDEAGNNLVNLLAKINSQDTAHDAQKLGINLSGTLAAARGKGMDSLDAFVGIVDQVVGRNKNYQALQARLGKATGADRRTILESQADILQGSAIGQIVQDRQALGALVGIMGNRGYMTDVQKQIAASAGTTDRNYDVVSAEAGFKTQQALNEKTFATQTAFEKLAPTVGSLADTLASLAREHPQLATAAAAAATALTALAAAAGAAGLTNLLLGRGGAAAGGIAARAGGGLLARMGVTAAFAGAMPVGTLAGLGATGAATVAGGVALAGAAGLGIGTLISKAIEGTAVSDAIGRSIAQALAFFGNEEARHSLQVEVDVKNGNIVAAVNEANARQARRN
jgi:hypothetical protein